MAYKMRYLICVTRDDIDKNFYEYIAYDGFDILGWVFIESALCTVCPLERNSRNIHSRFLMNYVGASFRNNKVASARCSILRVTLLTETVRAYLHQSTHPLTTHFQVQNFDRHKTSIQNWSGPLSYSKSSLWRNWISTNSPLYKMWITFNN